MNILPSVLLIAILLAGCQNRTDFSYAPIVLVSIPDMHCESCVAKTTEVLAEQAGVRDVKVDLEAKMATVAVDRETFDGPAIIAVLEDYGFAESKIVKKQ